MKTTTTVLFFLLLGLSSIFYAADLVVDDIQGSSPENTTNYGAAISTITHPLSVELNTVAPTLAVKGTNYLISTLTEGVKAFQNRSNMFFTSIPQEFVGWDFTYINANSTYLPGPLASFSVKAATDGFLYGLVEDRAKPEIVQAWAAEHGWTTDITIGIPYGTSSSQTAYLYKKTITAGEWVEVIQPKVFSGITIIAPAISDESGTADCEIPDMGGVALMNSPKHTGKYLGSPSIVILPNGNYLASFEFFGGPQTFIYMSDDRGENWEKVTELAYGGWANLFVLDSTLYLMGTMRAYSNLIIIKSTDWGKTWTYPSDASNGILKHATSERAYHTAPCPVAIKDGRIYRAIEEVIVGKPWGENFLAMIVSAPVDSDLLNAENWTFSNTLEKNSTWLQKEGFTFGGWLEGNAVVATDGSIVNVLRVHEVVKGDKAAITRLASDNKTLTFNPIDDIVNFPGGAKKFTIRFDTVSGLYIALSNIIPDEFRNLGTNAERTRNTVAMIYSRDLVNWDIHKIVMQHQDVFKHGFQYLDWQFDGEDIIALSRTAWDDCTGGADNQHNSNYISFHRFENFRAGLPITALGNSDQSLPSKTEVRYLPPNQLNIKIQNDVNTNYSIFDISGKKVKSGSIY